MSELLQIDTLRRGHQVQVAPRGEVDMTCSDQLAEALRAAARIPNAQRLVVDLTDVSFMDSTGIGALVTGRHQATAHGKHFQVINSHGIVARILTVSGVGATLGGDPDCE